MFEGFDLNTIMYLAIFLGLQVGIQFLFVLVRKLRKEVKTFKEMMLLVNLQYQQQDKIIKQTDKDPNSESRTEKIFKYVGKQIETVTDFVNADENEFMSETDKIQYVQTKIIERVKEVIKDAEGENSELINDQLIIDITGYVLKFITPFIIKK